MYKGNGVYRQSKMATLHSPMCCILYSSTSNRILYIYFTEKENMKWNKLHTTMVRVSLTYYVSDRFINLFCRVDFRYGALVLYTSLPSLGIKNITIWAIIGAISDHLCYSGITCCTLIIRVKSCRQRRVKSSYFD